MPGTMTLQEKYLYHQIHPLKLLTDWSAGLLALYPLWRHRLGIALIIMVVPPALVSWFVIRCVDLERQRASAFGRYVRQYMTRAMEAVRLAGFIVMAAGAWYRSAALVFAGLAIVLLGWVRGLLISSG